MKSTHVLLALLLPLGALAQAPVYTPVPPKKTPFVVVAPPEPTRPPQTPSLSDLARRLKERPPSENHGTVSGGAGPDLAFSSLRIDNIGSGTRVRGTLRNTGSRALWVVVIAECRGRDGEPDAYIVETSNDGPLEGGRWAQFDAELPEIDSRTVRVRAFVAGMGGRIETAEERRLTACLSFGTVLPLPPSMVSPSLELRISNGCDKPVPASRTWYLLVVRDVVGNVVAQKADRLRDPIPPGGMGRRQVSIRVPAGARVEVGHYDPFG